MIWTKGAHQSAKFQTFECSRNISPNLYFDRLLSIQYKILAEKVCTEELHFMTLKIDAKFVEKLICCFKNDRNLVNFHPSTQSLKYLYFHWFLLCKIFNVWPRKAQRSYLSWHWRVMQNLKKNWLVVWKMTWGIWQIFTRALESVKIGTLMGFFCPKYKMYELKIYRGVTVTTMKNDTKIEEEMTCRFKIDMRNFTNFHPSTWKFKNFVF